MAKLSVVKLKQQLPSTLPPGDFLYCHELGACFMGLADGRVFPLAGLLSANPGRGVGPHGERGERGADSTVPGPKGERGEKGGTGERGAKGEPGDVTVVGDTELAAAVTALRAQIARARAALQVAMEDTGKLRGHAATHTRLTLQRLQKESGL